MKITKLLFTLGLVLFLTPLQSTYAEQQFISDFNDSVRDWDSVDQDVPTSVTEVNGQLNIRAQFPASMQDLSRSLTAVSWNRDQPIREGQTLEYRVELVRTSQEDVLAGIEYSSAAPTEGLYGFLKDGNRVFLAKVNLRSGIVANFFHETTSIKHQNVILSLALTGVGNSVRITTRILDKLDGEAVLFEKTILDTSGVDATVAALPFHNLQPDPGPAYRNGRWHGLYLAQYTEGNQPAVEVVSDNFTFEYRPADPFSKITNGEIVMDKRFFWGRAWGDFDDDGFIDLFVTSAAPSEGNILYHNQGDATFLKQQEIL